MAYLSCAQGNGYPLLLIFNLPPFWRLLRQHIVVCRTFSFLSACGKPPRYFCSCYAFRMFSQIHNFMILLYVLELVFSSNIWLKSGTILSYEENYSYFSFWTQHSNFLLIFSIHLLSSLSNNFITFPKLLLPVTESSNSSLLIRRHIST